MWKIKSASVGILADNLLKLLVLFQLPTIENILMYVD
jgi:hypothetical protein